MNELNDPSPKYRPLVFFTGLAKFLFAHHSFVAMGSNLSSDMFRFEGTCITSFLLASYWGLFVLLPWRKTNALFLRSFSSDAESDRMRNHVQRALGWRFRASGIRDPYRRMSEIERYFAEIVFLVRYSIPTYMNLEAGADWKVRLINSMHTMRCALIDLRDVTPFLLDEIRLAIICMGWERVLFVINEKQSPEVIAFQIRKLINGLVACDSPVQIVTWKDSRTGRREFREGVRKFRDALPPGARGVRAHPYLDKTVAESPQAEGSSRPEVLAMLCIILMIPVLGYFQLLEIAITIIGFAIMVWFLIEFLIYFILCGSVTNALRVGLAWAAGTAFYYWVFNSI